MKKTLPRLHVIPAAACDKALILRRGPTDVVASLLWDRDSNAIQMGQWLRGRIYEHRCDVSPDGRHAVVFARKNDASVAWTALSRAPWLRALQFYPQDHIWHGGGAFDADGRLWLNGTLPPDTSLPDGLHPADASSFPHATDGFHMGDLYVAKLALRGWVHKGGTGYDMIATKQASHGWALELSIQLQADNRSIVSDSFALVHVENGLRLAQPHWEWADIYKGILQFAERGCLRQAVVTPEGKLNDHQQINDFSDMAFEAINAPYEGTSMRGYAS